MLEFILLTLMMNGLILTGLYWCRRSIPIRAPVLLIATGMSVLFCVLYPFMASFLSYPAVIYCYVLLVAFGGVLLLFVERFYFSPEMAAGEQLIEVPAAGGLAVVEAVKVDADRHNYEQPVSPDLLLVTGGTEVIMDLENRFPEFCLAENCLPVDIPDINPAIDRPSGCDDLFSLEENINTACSEQLLEDKIQESEDVPGDVSSGEAPGETFAQDAGQMALQTELHREDSRLDRHGETAFERASMEIAVAGLPEKQDDLEDVSEDDLEDNLGDNRDDNAEGNSGPAVDSSGPVKDVSGPVEVCCHAILDSPESPDPVEDACGPMGDLSESEEYACGPMDDISMPEEDDAESVVTDTAGERVINDPPGPMEDNSSEGIQEIETVRRESPGESVTVMAKDRFADYRQLNNVNELVEIAFDKKNTGDLPGAVSVFMYALKLDPQPRLAMLICIEMSSIYRDIGQRVQSVGVLEMFLARWGGGLGEKVVKQIKSVINELRGESK